MSPTIIGFQLLTAACCFRTCDVFSIDHWNRMIITDDFHIFLRHPICWLSCDLSMNKPFFMMLVGAFQEQQEVQRGRSEEWEERNDTGSGQKAAQYAYQKQCQPTDEVCHDSPKHEVPNSADSRQNEYVPADLASELNWHLGIGQGFSRDKMIRSVKMLEVQMWWPSAAMSKIVSYKATLLKKLGVGQDWAILLALGLHVSVTLEVSGRFSLARETNTDTIVVGEIQGL